MSHMSAARLGDAPIVLSARLNASFVASRLTAAALRDETPAVVQELTGFLAYKGHAAKLMKIAEQLPASLAGIVRQACARYGASVH
jgi:hypothetical protein